MYVHVCTSKQGTYKPELECTTPATQQGTSSLETMHTSASESNAVFWSARACLRADLSGCAVATLVKSNLQHVDMSNRGQASQCTQLSDDRCACLHSAVQSLIHTKNLLSWQLLLQTPGCAICLTARKNAAKLALTGKIPVSRLQIHLLGCKCSKERVRTVVCQAGVECQLKRAGMPFHQLRSSRLSAAGTDTCGLGKSFDIMQDICKQPHLQAVKGLFSSLLVVIYGQVVTLPILERKPLFVVLVISSSLVQAVQSTWKTKHWHSVSRTDAFYDLRSCSAWERPCVRTERLTHARHVQQASKAHIRLLQRVRRATGMSAST